MLTFSKNTQQDFIRRIDKIDTDKLINTDNIRTIDSLANKIIGVDGTIDVNLLSYKFKKYLEDTKTDDLVKNKDLNQIKILFVDEAQDLNETQFNIISNLNKKLKIIVNLIGDPNQNIYQFRKSSDKYLMNFKAHRFYLTHNFRSSQSIINFCKYFAINNLDGDKLLMYESTYPLNKSYMEYINLNNDEYNKWNSFKNHVINYIDKYERCIQIENNQYISEDIKSSYRMLKSNLARDFRLLFQDSMQNIRENDFNSLVNKYLSYITLLLILKYST